MVEDYLSDREQEEALRSWWRENWRWVIGGVVLGLAGLGGWQYWQQRTQANAEQAAKLYGDLTGALSSHDADKAKQLMKELDDDYGSSPYADLGHLALAQDRADAQQFAQAADELHAVMHSKDTSLAEIAQLRLARVQLQLGHPDEALALLDVDKAGAFATQVGELRGDALLAKGDRSGAQLAYQSAMNAGEQDDRDATELLHLKLQALSDAESDVKPAAAQ